MNLDNNTTNQRIQPNIKNLTDAAFVRSNELARILAGCALVDGERSTVLELVSRLNPGDITDRPARIFLDALAEKPDIEPLALVVSLGLAGEYVRWLAICADFLFDIRTEAKRAYREIQRLAITRQALTDLTGWLAETESIAGYRGGFQS